MVKFSIWNTIGGGMIGYTVSVLAPDTFSTTELLITVATAIVGVFFISRGN